MLFIYSMVCIAMCIICFTALRKIGPSGDFSRLNKIQRNVVTSMIGWHAKLGSTYVILGYVINGLLALYAFILGAFGTTVVVAIYLTLRYRLHKVILPTSQPAAG